MNSNEDKLYSTTFLQEQADWLDAHLTEVEQREVQPRWVICYAHLSPFTVERNKKLQCWVSVIEKHQVDMFLCGHNHAWSVSKPIYCGYDSKVNAPYNDFATKVEGTTELKIVEELAADGNEIRREADPARGTYYVLNQATGYKLSGKQKPITNLAGKSEVQDKHRNPDGSPWWIDAQSLPNNPVFIDLQIGYDQIICDSYEILNIKGSDEFKNAIINQDLSKVEEKKFHTLTINHEDREK